MNLIKNAPNPKTATVLFQCKLTHRTDTAVPVLVDPDLYMYRIYKTVKDDTNNLNKNISFWYRKLDNRLKSFVWCQ